MYTYMLLSRNKKVQSFVTSLLVVELGILLPDVQRKFDFFSATYQTIVIERGSLPDDKANGH